MLALRNWFILIFLPVVLLPITMFLAWPYSRALNKEIDLVNERHLILARSISVTLERYSGDTKSTFDHFSEALIAGRAAAGAQALLAGLNFHSICAVDSRSGRLVSGVASGSNRCPAALSDDMMKAVHGLGDQTRTYLTGATPGEGGRAMVHLIRKVGERTVIGSLDTSYFGELARTVRFGGRGHAIIVDQFGRVLAGPFGSADAQRPDLSGLAIIERLQREPIGVARYVLPGSQEVMVAGFAAVPGAGWGIIVAQPLAELQDSIARIRLSTLPLITAGLLLAALFAIKAAIILHVPLQRLIAGAERMARGEAGVRLGNLGRRVPREFAQLTDAFNAMAESIEHSRAREAQSRAAAEAANASKSKFLRNVTHELRSPLNAVIGFADVLVSERYGPLGSDRYRTYARDIRAGSLHLLSLTNDLLDLARIEAGQYQLSETDVFPDEIALRAVRFIEVAARDRAISVEIRQEGGAVTLSADERAIFQSVLNLVSNAVRYGRAGGAIAITLRATAAGGFEFEVADDGPGIAAADLERVLLPFQRIVNASTQGVQGSGLGLPIVKQLAELHGGTFRLESELGQGTRGIIVLPPARVVRDAPADPVLTAA
jgi:signal transduction histidine kinase